MPTNVFGIHNITNKKYNDVIKNLEMLPIPFIRI